MTVDGESCSYRSRRSATPQCNYHWDFETYDSDNTMYMSLTLDVIHNI